MPRYKRPSGTSVVEDDAPGILSRKEEEAELAFGLLLQMSSGREREGTVILAAIPGIPHSTQCVIL